MKSLVIIMVVLFISLLFLGMITGISYFSYSNQEISLRNQITAQSTVCKSFFDKMWKIIKQKASVSDKYKDAFKEIYPSLIEGRYGNSRGGSLLSFIQESNPQLSVSIYEDLSRSIEAERTGFFKQQEKLIDLKRVHDNLIDQFPSGLFIGKRGKININIITSETTENIYKTGQENDISL